MSKKVVFITSSHNPFDDRIYYNQALSLVQNGFQVSILCSTYEIKSIKNNIKVIGLNGNILSKKNKINRFISLLTSENPDIIICSEPLPIVASKKYKRQSNSTAKIISDITEWYPSKKNLVGYSHVGKIIAFIKLLLFNYYASLKADGFIFGEYYKEIPYKILFPFKKSIRLTYYPNLNYIKYTEIKMQPNHLCLGYTGKLSIEKGILNFLKVVKYLSLKHPYIHLRLKLVGFFANEHEKHIFNNYINEIKNIELEIIEPLDFEVFSEKIQDVNIFFDLRDIDFENTRCLPIKLFYYAACGRPIIYSKLKAINKEIDIKSFGHLVNPKSTELIVDQIINYNNNPTVYNLHCKKARELSETKYNWHNIEAVFLKYISEMIVNQAR